METNIELFNLGNQTCSRCHDLEKELGALKTEMKAEQNKIKQLQLKHKEEMQTLENEKNDKMFESMQLKEEQIETLSEEKNKIDLQLRDQKAEMEKKLTYTKEKHAKAVRKKDRFKKENTESSQLIEKLNKEKKKLIRDISSQNSSPVKTQHSVK